MYKFGPNNFNYVSCDRCFYLLHKLKIEIKGNFPEIFSSLDLRQKDFFINKGTSELSEKLPDGKFFKTVTKDERKKRVKKGLAEFNELEIPATITSKGLKDNKGREYILSGKPDLVTKFDNSFGILDFKTTSEKDKSHNYRFQLESYAQIFENPLDGPNLSPFSHMGLIQFTPAEIISSDMKSITQKMKMNYFSLERNVEEFRQFITDKIDILEQNNIPEKSLDCKICNSADKYSEVLSNDT
tara:strand:+ start:190 stop:915 length:726 start_codon:yes stop_codon:yes gene_type:complete